VRDFALPHEISHNSFPGLCFEIWRLCVAGREEAGEFSKALKKIALCVAFGRVECDWLSFASFWLFLHCVKDRP